MGRVKGLLDFCSHHNINDLTLKRDRLIYWKTTAQSKPWFDGWIINSLARLSRSEDQVTCTMSDFLLNTHNTLTIYKASPFAPFVHRYNDNALLLALCSSHSVGLDPRTLYNVERRTLRKFFCPTIISKQNDSSSSRQETPAVQHQRQQRGKHAQAHLPETRYST